LKEVVADHLGCLHRACRERRRVLPEAAWQRCIVHWYCNVFSHVASTKVREIAAMLKAIHASEDIVAAREKAIRVLPGRELLQKKVLKGAPAF